MSLRLPPFWNERVKSVLDTSRNKVRQPSRWRVKLSTFLNIPAFNVVNTWRGSSEIVAKFVYSLSTPVSFISDLPIANGNFCPCVSWKPTSETIVRYKLWENVGEILYVPLYTGQQIGANFNIEIWSTNNSPIVGTGDKLYLSFFQIPTTLCEEGEVDFGAGVVTCDDITFNLTGWNPSIGEYYNVVSVGGCSEGELVNL